MTKKAIALINKLENNYEVNYSVAKIVSDKTYVKDTQRINNEFQDLVTGMFRYKLLNEADFTKLLEESTHMYFYYLDKFVTL